MQSGAPTYNPSDIPKDAKIGIIAARFNDDIVQELLSRCIARFKALLIDGSRIQTHRVPGAFELPLAAKLLARTKKFHAIICLGCVIRGDTPHFDYVAGCAARGIQQVAIEEALPVIFGLLTTETHAQAVARLDAGARAADAALEMIALAARVKT